MPTQRCEFYSVLWVITHPSSPILKCHMYYSTDFKSRTALRTMVNTEIGALVPADRDYTDRVDLIHQLMSVVQESTVYSVSVYKRRVRSPKKIPNSSHLRTRHPQTPKYHFRMFEQPLRAARLPPFFRTYISRQEIKPQETAKVGWVERHAGASSWI
ncbi:hypothetical protein BDV41DRAFT_124781 [Aspergillus transmontanensis]|uniref:Uncharacterized protein n=1 Tax=Aspergillus transmontanensis TaxID=1034304 RepID=A0A5N6W680_9EURO|nr:hypothetical protein BDV41DRAFT_124781 [Aspergillus transmontanensis]